MPCPHETPAVTAEAIETITRDITLSSKARAESLESMTGSIILQRDSRVTRDVETGNGMLVLEPGSEVAGDLSNDTGTIRIDGARVGGQVSTTYGDIYVGAESRVDGGIVVHKRNVIGLSFGDLKLGVPMGRARRRGW